LTQAKIRDNTLAVKVTLNNITSESLETANLVMPGLPPFENVKNCPARE